MSDNSKYRALLDEIAKAIDKYPFGFTYTDLPDQVRQHIAVHADPYSERNQAASAWKAISTHPLIGDLPLLPERGTYADSVRARLDEIAAKASLPEPDATNPDHLRWTAEMIETSQPGGHFPGRGHQRNVLADDLRGRADRLDVLPGLPSGNGEQRIEAVAERIWETSRADEGSISATGAKIVAHALDAAGLLRGGGRGE